MTLRDVIARLDEFSADETIYAESAAPTARAVVAAEPEERGAPEEPGLPYLIEVALARDGDRRVAALATRADAIAR